MLLTYKLLFSLSVPNWMSYYWSVCADFDIGQKPILYYIFDKTIYL